MKETKEEEGHLAVCNQLNQFLKKFLAAFLPDAVARSEGLGPGEGETSPSQRFASAFPSFNTWQQKKRSWSQYHHGFFISQGQRQQSDLTPTRQMRS